MKKNTLLYLDEGLVKKAKKEGWNISKLSEDAIKEKLGFDVELDPKALLDLLLSEGCVYFLPFKIKSVEVSNIKNIKYLQTELKEINFVVGKNASGKTNLIKSIVYPFNNSVLEGEDLLFHGSKNGFIKISPEGNLEDIALKIHKKDSEIFQNYKCIIINDDSIPSLNPKLLSYLLKRNFQIIMPCRRLPDFKHKEIKIINL